MKYPIKVLLDEKKQPFLPFTTTECVLVDGTDLRMTEYLNAFIAEKNQDVQDTIDGLEQYTEQRMVELDKIIEEATQLKNDAANGAFDGEDGITPTIGTNGNWHLGRQDTGLPSRGERGPIGPQGIQGPKGDPGEKGDPGSGGASVTYDFAMTTELPDLDYGVQEQYEVELNEEDILQLEEFVNAYANEKCILNVSFDGVTLWSFSDLLANIEMLDEVNFSLILENRFIENITLNITGTFDGTNYTVTDTMLMIAMGDIDYINNRLAELEHSSGGSTSFYRIKTTEYIVDANNSWNLEFANLLTPILQENLDKPFLLEVNDANSKSVLFNIFYGTPTKDLSNNTHYIYGVHFKSDGNLIFKQFVLKINYTSSTGVISVGNVQGNNAWNTCATTSYVDTAITNAITNVLEDDY